MLSCCSQVIDDLISNNAKICKRCWYATEELQLLEIDFLNRMDHCVATDTLHFAEEFRAVIKILSMLITIL